MISMNSTEEKELDLNHVLIELPENISDLHCQDLTKKMRNAGLSVVIQKNPTTRFFNSLEWMIPTTLVLWILKPYFESFLKEAGKDHYLLVKRLINTIVNDARNEFRLFSWASKKAEDGKQSHAVSLILQTKSGQEIKLLFDENLKKEDWEEAIDHLLEYVIEHYEKEPQSRLGVATRNLEKHLALKYPLRKMPFWGYCICMRDYRILIKPHLNRTSNGILFQTQMVREDYSKKEIASNLIALKKGIRDEIPPRL